VSEAIEVEVWTMLVDGDRMPVRVRVGLDEDDRCMVIVSIGDETHYTSAGMSAEAARTLAGELMHAADLVGHQ
jgi:hypothetical protein